jgi:ribonuclease P protein component
MQRGSGRFSRGSLSLLVGRSPNGAANASRLGMVVSRKVGTAVKRNAVKRWLREWFRTRGAELPRGLDFVVIAKPGAAERGHQVLLGDITALLTRVIASRAESIPGELG